MYAFGVVVLGVGIWQGWWPLWVIGAVILLAPILAKGSSVNDAEVHAYARLQFRDWEEALIQERAKQRRTS